MKEYYRYINGYLLVSTTKSKKLYHGRSRYKIFNVAS